MAPITPQKPGNKTTEKGKPTPTQPIRKVEIPKKVSDFLYKRGIEEAKSDVGSIIQYIGLIDKSIQAYKTEMDTTNANVRTLEDLSWALRYLSGQRLANYRKILIDYADKALKVNKDLDIPQWRAHLLEILNKDNMVSVSPVISDSTDVSGNIIKECEVTINIEPIAGTIEDYKRAIKYARSIVHGGYGNKVKGPLATHLWYSRLWLSGREPGYNNFLGIFNYTREVREVIGKSGKKRKIPVITSSNRVGYKPNLGKDVNLDQFYWEIMDARMSDMGNKAPYWYLLNYGSVNFGDGGTAAPLLVPTFFVESAKSRIANQAYQDLATEVNINASRRKSQTTRLTEAIDLANQMKEELASLLDELLGGVTYKSRVNKIIDLITSQWEPMLKNLESSQNALKIVRQRIEILANEILGGIDTGQRLYLVTVQGKEYRRRLTQLVNLIRQKLPELSGPELSQVNAIKARKITEKLSLELKALQKQINSQGQNR